MSELKFQEWLMEHQPENKYLYKDRWCNTYVFIRDKILPLMTDSAVVDYNAMLEEINRNTEIVGTHWSKSLLHPVIKINYRDVTIVFRYNFYNYEIAVISDIPIDLPKYLRRCNNRTYFYEGFPEEYQLKTPYSRRHNTEFMAYCGDHYDFFTFCVILKDQIDKCRRRSLRA